MSLVQEAVFCDITNKKLNNLLIPSFMISYLENRKVMKDEKEHHGAVHKPSSE